MSVKTLKIIIVNDLKIVTTSQRMDLVFISIEAGINFIPYMRKKKLLHEKILSSNLSDYFNRYFIFVMWTISNKEIV